MGNDEYIFRLDKRDEAFKLNSKDFHKSKIIVDAKAIKGSG